MIKFANVKFMAMKKIFAAIMLVTAVLVMSAETRSRENFDRGWWFAFGNAASPEKDFGSGTEYFNYLTKAASIHNQGPYALEFDMGKSGSEWKSVQLPHDWAVDLPYSKEASHSHGFHTVGYKYPETSVGWYRKEFEIPAKDEGKHIWLEFDGIFRNAQVWVNGFYMGQEPSGYAQQIYDITDYLNYGGNNVVAVRADATLEEGWFYEGAGIYRHVWLCMSQPVHFVPNGTDYTETFGPEYKTVTVSAVSEVKNSGREDAEVSVVYQLLDATGQVVAESTPTATRKIKPQETVTFDASFKLDNPRLWSDKTPYLYTVWAELKDAKGTLEDLTQIRIGMRDIEFDADRGFILNGQPVKLKGVNMHQDHPGVGAGIPDALQVYRLKKLKEFGVNAYRSSHNPMTPEMLDACDSLGILVIEENRLTGINDEHHRLLEKLIRRDRNHPSIIAWSVGNEEWGIEWSPKGEKIAHTMRDWVHRLDPTRPMTVATSSGPTIVIPADVAGYNYIAQNPVDEHRKNYPQRRALGSEETTGAGTRGVYVTDTITGRMMSHNRKRVDNDSLPHYMERGWKFYDERPWLAGLFFWTGFDYKGEPNPMPWPATGSQFGILDYAGFPKDEMYYLKSWWKPEETTLHILPHWNLDVPEGTPVELWVYSNCDEVDLSVNGKSLGRKKMPHNGYLAWKAPYKTGKVVVRGYKNGKLIVTETVETAGEPAIIKLSADRPVIKADGVDVSVLTAEITDKKGRFAPTTCLPLTIRVEGPGRIIGVGNGDPAYKTGERPTDTEGKTYQVDTFNGLAQILIANTGEPGQIVVTVTSPELKPGTITLTAR